MSTTEDRMETAIYELAYLLLPSIPEDSLSQSVSNLKEIIKKAGAQEIASEEPFLHPLAYSMSKVVGSSKYVVSEAYIGWVKFEVEPLAINTIKSAVENLDEVLRLLIVKASRETTFTFENARKAAMAKEVARGEPESEMGEAEAPREVVEPEKESKEEAKEDVVE